MSTSPKIAARRLTGILALLIPMTFVTSFAFSRWSSAAPSDDPVDAAAEQDDAMIRELQKNLEGRRAEIEKLNAINPLRDKTAGASGSDESLQFPGAAAAGGDDAIAQLLNSPGVQGYMKLLANPSFQRGVQELMAHPNRTTLVYAEAGLLLFMIIFRAWRYSKAKSWMARFRTQAWTFALGVSLASLAVPSLVFGPVYWRLAQGTFETIVQGAPSSLPRNPLDSAIHSSGRRSSLPSTGRVAAPATLQNFKTNSGR